MKARLRKEGIRLDLTVPFGELDSVCGVLLTIPFKLFAHEKKRKKKREEKR